MFESLKRKIALSVIRRKVNKHNLAIRLFNGFVEKSTSFLFVLPVETEALLEALEVVNYFRIHKKHCTVIIHEINVNRTELEDFQIISYSEEDSGKFGLPSKEFLEQLSHRYYDVLVDLNFTENIFLLAVAAFVKAEFKIALNKPLAEMYANYISPVDLKNPEISYRNLLNSLRMF